MPEFFSAQEVVKAPFLFISYSHKNKPLVEDMARYLLDQGVRLWYDVDLVTGDDWNEMVVSLITHENCSGVIFVCSPAAYVSANIHREREAALKTQAQRGTGKYRLFSVNVCDNADEGSYMRMLKTTFDGLQADALDIVFPMEHFQTLMQLIGTDPICQKTANAAWMDNLMKDIERSAKPVVDKGGIALEQMQKAAGYSGLVIALGNYDGPLKWQLLDREGDRGLFLLQTPLPPAYGNGVEAWLNGDFLRHAFSDAEAAELVGPIRLLTKAEFVAYAADIPRADTAWWLRDYVGARQAVVLDDGTLSAMGALNQQLKRGIRPVITLNLNNAAKWLIK